MSSREPLKLNIFPVVGKQVWPIFAPHHYLTEKYAGHRAFLATLPDGTPVAFTSSISFPHAQIKYGRREHRTVVLPDFQGLGLGVRLSEWLGEWHLQQGHRFYSRTTHPRLGAYRDSSPLWRATGGNRKAQSSASLQGRGQGREGGSWAVDLSRVAYSHEYVGQRR